MKEEIKKFIEDFKNGTRNMFKEFFKKDTNKKQRANMLTFSRLIIPFITLICSAIAIITGTMPLFIASGILAGLGAVTDYFDGKSSRKHNSTSEYGKVLDQVSDKVFAGIIGINLVFININYLVILFGEALISAINLCYRAKYKDLQMNSSKIGKIKEWPLFLTLALGFLSPINVTMLSISNIFIAITFFIQALTAESYIRENSKKVKELKKNEKIKIIEEVENSNPKEETLEKNIDNSNKNNINKKELYEKLRNALLEIKNQKESSVDTDYTNSKIYVKK